MSNIPTYGGGDHIPLDRIIADRADETCEIDFRENTTEDKPIENMDELIKRQMAEREYDVQNIAKKKDDTDENIPIEAISLEPEKKVTFKEETTDNYLDKIDSINQRIDDFVKEFSEKMEAIQNDIQNIKSEQKKMLNVNSRRAEDAFLSD